VFFPTSSRKPFQRELTNESGSIQLNKGNANPALNKVQQPNALRIGILIFVIKVVFNAHFSRHILRDYSSRMLHLFKNYKMEPYIAPEITRFIFINIKVESSREVNFFALEGKGFHIL